MLPPFVRKPSIIGVFVSPGSLTFCGQRAAAGGAPFIGSRRACYHAFSMARLPFLPYLRKRLPQMVETLRELTLLESPSLEKGPTDRCCEFLAEKWLRHGTIVQIRPQK